MEEVWSVVKDLPLDKAPGPDGFTGRFYKVCWDIIKEDMMGALLAVQCGHVSKLKLLNMTFITPKKSDTQSHSSGAAFPVGLLSMAFQ